MTCINYMDEYITSPLIKVGVHIDFHVRSEIFFPAFYGAL